MANEIMPSGPHKDFEGIKKIDENGVEYWEARHLMIMLEYERWENAEETIKRAQRACVNSGQTTEDHFRKDTKMVSIGSKTARAKKFPGERKSNGKKKE